MLSHCTAVHPLNALRFKLACFPEYLNVFTCSTAMETLSGARRPSRTISCSTDDLGKAAGKSALSWLRCSLHQIRQCLHLQHRDGDVVWHEAPLPHDLLQHR